MVKKCVQLNEGKCLFTFIILSRHVNHVIHSCKTNTGPTFFFPLFSSFKLGHVLIFFILPERVEAALMRGKTSEQYFCILSSLQIIQYERGKITMRAHNIFSAIYYITNPFPGPLI